MADVSISYDQIMDAVNDLRNAGGFMWNELQEFQMAMTTLSNDFHGQLSNRCGDFRNWLAEQSTQMSHDISDASSRLESMADYLATADLHAAHGITF